MGAGLKQLKVIVRGKTIAGSKFQSLKIIGINDLGESVGSILTYFNSEGVMGFCKLLVSYK